jgi:hypothetical protein
LATAPRVRILSIAVPVHNQGRCIVRDINEIVAFVVGYSFALAGGFFYVSKVVELLRGFEGGEQSRERSLPSRVVGLIERALYVTALLIGQAGFVALWLVLKVAADWRFERHGNRPTKLAYNTFFVGSGLSLLFAAAGTAVVQLGAGAAWIDAAGIVLAMLLGAEGLRQLGIYQLKKVRRATEAVVREALQRERLDQEEVLAVTAAFDAPEEPEATVAVDLEPEVEGETPYEIPARRVRRSPAEIDQLAEEVLAAVKEDPGQGTAEIAEVLHTGTSELRRPLQLLLESRMLKKQGEGRQTKYRPGPSRRKKVSRAPARSGKKKARRKKKR